MCDVLFGETLKEMMTQFQVESLRTGYDCRCTVSLSDSFPLYIIEKLIHEFATEEFY